MVPKRTGPVNRDIDWGVIGVAYHGNRSDRGPKVRIEQLEYVMAVARLGSFRRVGEALHISQPALSETVRNLERELGVTLLERRRSGVRISESGQELLSHMAGVLEAVDRLRAAADEQHQTSRMVRLGTVNAATVPLMAPAIREFRQAHPSTQVEVIAAQQADIHRLLVEGGLDLGLVNLLAGDDIPPDLETTELLRGNAVVCMRTDDPLACLVTVSVEDLHREALIGMRAGYVMYRYVHRLFGGQMPTFSYSTDGAEMGKVMVAEGLGVTVLPDYSVIDDPLERNGVITCRPITGDDTEVLLVLQRRRSQSTLRTVRDLHATLVQRAASYEVERAS
jgi:DNA-binding transcriptional LysR family regulator